MDKIEMMDKIKMKETAKLLTSYIQGDPRDGKIITMQRHVEDFLIYCEIDISKVREFIEVMEPKPQVQEIDYRASCGHVHPGQSCGEWIRSQVYNKHC